ncbi:MAG: branched-chain amino acid ABC transporter permease [Pseudomonadota bacterium]
MNELVFFINKVVISGSVIGSIYALGAIGITLIFGILRFAHFAHGDLMTVGAFVALILTGFAASYGIQTPLPLAFVIMPASMIVTAIIAMGLDRTFYRPLRVAGAKPVVLVMASIGVTLMLQGLIRLFAGTQSRSLYIDERKEIFRIDLGEDITRNIVITEPQILLVGFTLVTVILLHVFLTRSRMGKAMRAVSDNADLARLSGIKIDQVVRTTWIIGGGLAAAAGTLLALDVVLKPDLSFNILLPIFAAAIVGGIGQPYGAIAGGFVVGFSETLAIFNWSILLRPLERAYPQLPDIPASIAFVPTEYKIVVPFFILVLVLIWRPSGIFKGRVF